MSSTPPVSGSAGAGTSAPASAGGQGENVAAELVSLYQKQKKIYARAVSGWFAGWRWALVWATQIVFYGLPWLEWNTRQAVLFDLGARRFYIFGLVLYPQDFIYLTGLLVISAYSLFLFTAVAGRLSCGYACPQTVYTQIFMWIETWIEGDRNARIKLDQAPMSFKKLRLKVAKHGLWLALSLWTSFTFVGYFSPVKELWSDLLAWNLGPWETFWIFFYAGFTYIMAGHMRELVCRHMCPYARFQSVMFDPDTMIITYDEKRGEPRGQRMQDADHGHLGDCVDCGLCVRVCPTGIDIRNGLQYECIGCASCIDICDEVMEKVGKPKGLVRYSTENAMAGNYARMEIFRHVIRPRIMVYTGILIFITIVAAWFLANRIPLKVDVIRDRSSLAREMDDGRIENVFTLNVMNTEEKPHRYRITVTGLPGIAIVEHGEVDVPAASSRSTIIPVLTPPDAGKPGANPVQFEIVATDDPAIRVVEKASFMLR